MSNLMESGHQLCVGTVVLVKPLTTAICCNSNKSGQKRLSLKLSVVVHTFHPSCTGGVGRWIVSNTGLGKNATPSETFF
jgi:hypothetical protein